METESVTVRTQRLADRVKFFERDGDSFKITAHVRYDDQCGNGHNTFAITGTIDILRRGRWADYSGGCIHDDIARHFPELAPFIRWHLFNADGPAHYVENVLYLAGDRDCWGLRAGERRQIRNGKTGLPAWKLEPDGEPLPRYVDAEDCPPGTITYRYVPWERIGEGKAREFEAARAVAVWPDATDAELSQEPDALRAVLLARLPALISDFRDAMESLGFTY